MEDVRTFVAITLAGAARTAVEALLVRLRADATGIAWTKPENLHVTLKFLGDVSPERLEALAPSLAAVAATHEPFVLDVRGVGGFPSLARPRAFWVGVHAAPLAPIAAAVDAACAAHGWAHEARPFRPHVTLGRVRRSRGSRGRPRSGPADLLAVERDRILGPSPVQALVLFRSDLDPGGARHTPLGRWSLGGDEDR